MLREPPSARGYTPSVFQLLANTLEGLGNSENGSISIPIAQLIHSLVQVQQLDFVIEHINLMKAIDQMTKPDSNESY